MAQDFANVSVVASSPGYLRLHVPALHRSLAVQRRLEAALAHHPDIASAYASPLTARVLLVFAARIDRDALLRSLGVAPPAAAPRAPATGAEAAPTPERQPIYPPWHLREAGEALAYHATPSRHGLTQTEAARRLLHGKNMIPQAAPPSSAELLLNQFKTMPVLLLAVSALLSAATGGIAEAAALAAVLALNGAIGFITERRAQATIASLSELVDDVASVLRNGAPREVPAADIAPGDLLLLAPGTRIAGDLRLLDTRGLLVDESALTGESLPVAKDSARLPGTPPLAERRNMAYRGTSVSMGCGLGLVVGTGRRTEAGAIEAMTSGTQRARTPLQGQLDQLGNQLVKISSGMCGGIFALGLLRGYPPLQMFKVAASLDIAAVPEGLPAVATTALARGIRRMREQHVLIRHLHAVETLGAIQPICLDKTGTLTMNRMAAVAIAHADGASREMAAGDPADGDPASRGPGSAHWRLHGRRQRHADTDRDVILEQVHACSPAILV
jgi:Ca2+-transporting ATPase